MSNPEMRRSPRRREQFGVSLIELLVGMTIGALVIVAAIGTLSVSRGISGSVSDLSLIQQQGSYAMHLIGSQLRQTASVDPIRDETTHLYAFGGQAATFGSTSAAVSGTNGQEDNSDTMSVASFPSNLAGTDWQRDCLGNTITQGTVMDATFKVTDGQLTCTSQKAIPGIVARNVADLQVNYRIRTSTGVQIMDADALKKADLWSEVSGIEVCLDLHGGEKGPDAASAYKDCHGNSKPRDGLTHLVFRNVFTLRVQSNR
ncbi:MAG: prepilin-type N-terminal cleavage/methylation domain-containing protein [Variovorax sp.]|nr:prepilin-type N-terminal cleavage/methylation domain-containing protein [Variovorax sp.]